MTGKTNSSVHWAVFRTVNVAVYGAVYGAVGWAVDEAVWNARDGAPPHPALKDYLGEAR